MAVLSNSSMSRVLVNPTRRIHHPTALVHLRSMPFKYHFPALKIIATPVNKSVQCSAITGPNGNDNGHFKNSLIQFVAGIFGITGDTDTVSLGSLGMFTGSTVGLCALCLFAVHQKFFGAAVVFSFFSAAIYIITKYTSTTLQTNRWKKGEQVRVPKEDREVGQLNKFGNFFELITPTSIAQVPPTFKELRMAVVGTMYQLPTETLL